MSRNHLYTSLGVVPWIGFSRERLVTRDVTEEKTSQIQGNLHQWFFKLRPSGMIHIPEDKRILGEKGRNSLLTYQSRYKDDNCGVSISSTEQGRFG